MGKKIKSSQCKGRWCETHLFSMKSRLVLNTQSFEETIRFCPRLSRDKKILQRILPKLNRDHKCYTPFFILEEDESLYANHDERNRQIFQNNKHLQLDEISEIVLPFFNNSSELFLFPSVDLTQMMPRVSTGRRYCKVCKEDYEQYLEHTTSSGHQDCLRRHPYSAFIVDLAENFKLTKHQQKLNENNGNITQEIHEACIDSEMESALLEKETACREKQAERESHQNDF